MNLKTLSDSLLLETTKSLVTEERKLTTSILWHLSEIQRRRLYAEQGFGSLFDYAVRGLGYSEAAAGRRISARRLLVEVPEAEASLQSGELSLSTMCAIQHFFQNQESPTPREEKRELVFALHGKSRRDCEKALAAISPQVTPPEERERVISSTLTEIRFVADEELMAKLEKIRELDAHVNSDPSYLELFHRLADLALKKLDPALKKPRVSTPPAEESRPSETPRTESMNEPVQRHVPPALKRSVLRRDGWRCTYQAPDGREHNRQQALAKLGREVMRPYLRVTC